MIITKVFTLYTNTFQESNKMLKKGDCKYLNKISILLYPLCLKIINDCLYVVVVYTRKFPNLTTVM